MKQIIFLFILISFSSCFENHKESSNEKMNDNESKESLKNDTIFNNLDSAIAKPDNVIHLKEVNNYRNAKHLPSKIGLLVNLKTLQIACMEKLEDLPFEIGKLVNLEKLIIDNGNGCQMNISLPSSIGNLKKLKELNLNGAVDPTDIENHNTIISSKVKKLPQELSNLDNLEILELNRNGLQYFPNQIFLLKNLKVLRLAFNDLKEIPSDISKLKNLKELDISYNDKIELPNSLQTLDKLKVVMCNCSLKLKEQKELQNRFPKIEFIFDNIYSDCAANEE